MALHEESTNLIDELLHCISTSPHNSSLEEESPRHNYSYKVTPTAEENTTNPAEFYSPLSDTISSGIFEGGNIGSVSSHFTSPFHNMSTPALAVEPPTPRDNAFQFVDVSNSNLGISQLEARFDSPLKNSLNFRSPGGSFDSYGTEKFSSSSDGYPTDFLASPFLYPHSHRDPTTFLYPKGLGVPIARSNVRGLLDATVTSRKGSRHYHDCSGASSASSISGPSYDLSPPAIDPSALQPPLSKFQGDPTELMKNETNHIVSPFINQVVEQGPDGTITGRYSRPLTSTGRPSHARKTPPGHVKRPRNAFILFRSHACSSNLIPPSVEKDHRQISRIVSHMWKSLPAEEKIRWEREAEAEKELHRKLHPDYRYKPIYRKETPVKNSQDSPESFSSSKKKSNARKKLKGMKSNEAKGDSVSEDQGNFTAASKNSSAELRHEHDEEIRCEIVAKILMETKLSGITLDENQMEERVLEQLRLAKSKDAIRLQIKSQSQPDSLNDQKPSLLRHNPESTCTSGSESEKPQSNVLAFLQARRRSLVNRSNSAPPPPSPLRMMHVREVVYNPKSRGNRELSPDFPKPRLFLPDGEIKMENVAYPIENFAPEIFFTGDFNPSLESQNDLNPFLDINKGEMYYPYHCNPTPSEQLEQLFNSPDFTFADDNCFQSHSSSISSEFFTSPISDLDEYPIFNSLFSEARTNYHKPPPIEAPLEVYPLVTEDYASALGAPVAGLTSDL